ncbi:BZ3500_MvSof-1268-A1-R1_Chr1-1g01108 [Microbotryum saponariae]|uniref:BZ3500_MvSof-1268-A1-R1_Chr1-1g01108 protein n=1 Tax=Microbotryum saponariae TaxID=289078 RepID=A0A2X0MDQ2_9BASI|nr:BZ3500_MvSof-1268-A1-R1_Chr1-1g01108 [Microbotryum saponariae]SCZ93393.1 BZ3501_MvSof-1269-A2-R1_Chr1-1g00705 [Microbotryum saponariae]
MAGHAAGPRPAGAFHPHLPGIGYRLGAKLLGASMWFFIFYRARQDGAVLLGAHPWDQKH